MPLPLIGALLMNIGMLALWLIAILAFGLKMSPFGLGIAAILLALNIFGAFSIVARKPAARRFNAWFIGIWAALASLSNLQGALRGDMPRLITLVVVLGISVPVVRGLVRNPGVPAWLASNRSASGVATEDDSSGER